MADFAPVAASLREGVLEHFAALGRDVAPTTVETNAGWAMRRGDLLLRMLADDGLATIDGVDLVDLGCGFGALSCLFAAYGARVVAVDRKEERLAVGRAVAARHDLQADFVAGRMQVTRLPAASFDVAVLNNSLCYLVPPAERLRALRETRRILRPGGRVILRNPNRWVLRDPFSGLPLVHLAEPRRAVALARRLGRARSWVRMTSPPEAERELRDAGFEAIRHIAPASGRRPGTLQRVASYHHFVARRPGR